MTQIRSSRRRFARALGGLAATGALGACAGLAPAVHTKTSGRVLVVGAGYGGATAAKYLKHWGGARIEVLLVERNARFVSCPLSNLVLEGSRRIEDLSVGYQGLRQLGVTVVQDEVRAIDPARRRARFGKIADQEFERIVLAPGVDFDFGAVQGLDAAARETVLHAWKAGPQTVALRRQLEEMPDGGVYLLSVPLAPYRCPPGPYERACLVASYFKAHKPRSKVLVLDANPDITSKKGLFRAAFDGLYKGIIEYRPDSNVVEIDARSRTVITEVGDRARAEVLNIVPPQAAGAIARQAGLVNANDRWCQVDWRTLESTVAPGVHLLGDATLSAPAMPKSGHMANQHGKAAAAAIVEAFDGRTPQAPVMNNACYSFIDSARAVHVASVHRYDAQKKTMVSVEGAGGLSPAPTALEGDYANAWARNIWKDMLA